MIEYKMVRDGVEVTINIDDTVEIVFDWEDGSGTRYHEWLEYPMSNIDKEDVEYYVDETFEGRTLLIEKIKEFIFWVI